MCQVAILLACFNRKQKTIACLESFFNQKNLPAGITFSIYLVDDGSTDGTSAAVREKFPDVHIIHGNGQLFWAGGMRLCWTTARNSREKYDYYLLLNDDTFLLDMAVSTLFEDIKAIDTQPCIIIGSTKDPVTGVLSYGGKLLLNGYNSASKPVIPNESTPQLCHLANANIMLIPEKVVARIGIFSPEYTHSIADYDYSLKAKKAGIPTYIASQYCGFCEDDHGNNWKSGASTTLKQRIKYLYSIKGLAYHEYLGYIGKYFPFYLPQAWLLLWAKVLFPFLWDRFKGKNETSAN